MHFFLDPLFFTPIDLRFQRKVVASPLFPVSVLARRLLTRCGVCAHASMTEGNCVLDPNVTRMELVSGYASLCVAAGKPYFGWSGGLVLSEERLATVPLPDGWRLLGQHERLRLADLFEQRDTLQLQRANLRGRLALPNSRFCMSAAVCAEIMCGVRGE